HDERDVPRSLGTRKGEEVTNIAKRSRESAGAGEMIRHDVLLLFAEPETAHRWSIVASIRLRRPYLPEPLGPSRDKERLHAMRRGTGSDCDHCPPASLAVGGSGTAARRTGTERRSGESSSRTRFHRSSASLFNSIGNRMSVRRLARGSSSTSSR